MRAVVTEDYGSAPTVAEVATPTPGPGEVRVRLRASSLNGFDTQPMSAGGFGEYVVLPADHSIGRMPADLDHAAAGALGLAGSSAVASIDAVDLGVGDTVLVSGATGGVGAFVLQMAVARGATVIATAKPGAGTEHVRKLDATHVVDYTGDLAAQVREIAPGGVDVVMHFAGDPFELADLLAGGGRFVSLLGVGADQLAGRDVTASAVYAMPNPSLLETLGSAVASGQLMIPIQHTYTLDAVPQAFVDFAGGKLGKLAVAID